MLESDISSLYLTKGCKYTLDKVFTALLPIRLEKIVMSNCGLVILSRTGLLVVKPGFSWDGASGPTIDTASTFRGAFIHDVLYLLIRQGHLPLFHKSTADELLRDVMVLDGAWKWVAKMWFNAVQAFGLEAATKQRKIYVYPKKTI